MTPAETSDPDARLLQELGFSRHWQVLFEAYASADLVAARVIRSDRGSVLIVTSAGVIRAKPSPRLRKSASGPADLPAVGDWVAAKVPDDLDIALIEAVLERTSALTRGDPGDTSDMQVLAANINTVFVVHPIDEPPNPRRIERELSLAWDSGATPVIVLTKRDLSADPDAASTAVESAAGGVDVLVTNALAGEGIEQLLTYISGHRTAVLVGPSGAGKSTLVNALLGEQRQATREVRVNDGRGRHTTVTRELIQMPGGGVLIDTPGLRALGMSGSEDGISSAFPDIAQHAGQCRFRDCTHTGEPDCAVRLAVESGALSAERLASYHKLMQEAQDVTIKKTVRLREEEVRKSKVSKRATKDHHRRSDRDEDTQNRR